MIQLKSMYCKQKEKNVSIALTKQSLDLGIVTKNGTAMLVFYRDLLGLKYHAEIAFPADVVMHQLLCGESVIKLVVLPEAMAALPAAPGGIQGAVGYRYWTMSVSNLSEMVQTCSNAGVPLVVPETEIRPGVRIAIVTDPDGNWVEFLTKS